MVRNPTERNGTRMSRPNCGCGRNDRADALLDDVVMNVHRSKPDERNDCEVELLRKILCVLCRQNEILENILCTLRVCCGINGNTTGPQ